jgi:hypothetical protein
MKQFRIRAAQSITLVVGYLWYNFTIHRAVVRVLS